MMITKYGQIVIQSFYTEYFGRICRLEKSMQMAVHISTCYTTTATNFFIL